MDGSAQEQVPRGDPAGPLLQDTGPPARYDKPYLPPFQNFHLTQNQHIQGLERVPPTPDAWIYQHPYTMTQYAQAHSSSPDQRFHQVDLPFHPQPQQHHSASAQIQIPSSQFEMYQTIPTTMSQPDQSMYMGETQYQQFYYHPQQTPYPVASSSSSIPSTWSQGAPLPQAAMMVPVPTEIKNIHPKRRRLTSPLVCHLCGTTDTPEWRTGPDGVRLCNACGLYHNKVLKKKGPRAAAKAVLGENRAGAHRQRRRHSDFVNRPLMTYAYPPQMLQPVYTQPLPPPPPSQQHMFFPIQQTHQHTEHIQQMPLPYMAQYPSQQAGPGAGSSQQYSFSQFSGPGAPQAVHGVPGQEQEQQQAAAEAHPLSFEKQYPRPL